MRTATRETYRHLKRTNFAYDTIVEFKRLTGGVGNFWSARILGTQSGEAWRAVAERKGHDIYWHFLGPHRIYDKLTRNAKSLRQSADSG
ncbi:MAG: hypothetical protein ACYC96_16020 [Fimbriimonadaceae bacterium]